jgi:hypothetical protein
MFHTYDHKFVIVNPCYDGSTSKEWQPYASFFAAAFTKTLLCALPETIKSPVY